MSMELGCYLSEDTSWSYCSFLYNRWAISMRYSTALGFGLGERGRLFEFSFPHFLLPLPSLASLV